MPFMKKLICSCCLLSSILFCTAQIEFTRLSAKDFKALGFGAFVNLSVPVSDAHFVTVEGGFQYFHREDEEIGLIPVLLGYRYTLDKTGTGFYLEPNAGYCFGSTTIQKYDAYDMVEYGPDGQPAVQKITGPVAGIGFGYLFEYSGGIQFNLGLRYQHGFGNLQTNVLALRISHAITFGRRERD